VTLGDTLLFIEVFPRARIPLKREKCHQVSPGGLPGSANGEPDPRKASNGAAAWDYWQACGGTPG